MSNDVLLIPVTAVQPDLITRTEEIIYVPLASKESHGIVRIGAGLNITTAGLLSLDETVVDKKLNEVKMMLTDHIIDLDDKITDHVTDYNNPHRVTKSQVGLSNVDNTSDANKPVSEATRRELLRLENMISGARGALVYADYQEMVDALNGDDKKEYGVGQSIFIGDREVPDLWIYGVDDEYVEYPYVDDNLIETVLRYDGTIKIGYYVLAALESNEIVLDNVVTTDTVQTITGTKIFTEQIGILNGAEGEINFIKHINNNFLISSSDGENIVNIDEQLKIFNFYNKPLALEEYVDDNFISYTITQNLTEEQKQIARDNIGAGTGSGGTTPVNAVTTNTEQTITAKKIFTAPIEVAPNEDTQLTISEGTITHRIGSDDGSYSYMQLHNDGFSVLRYSTSLNTISALEVGNYGISIQTPTQALMLDNDGLKYNGVRVATLDDIGTGTGTSVEIVWWEE